MVRFVMAGAVAIALSMSSGADDVARQVSLPTPWIATDGAVIDFTVLRKGKPFGSHVLTFDRADDGELTVTTDVDLDVKFGPITAFKYRLDSVERWVDDQLVSLNGICNNDGKKAKVSAEAEAGMLSVASSEFNGDVATTIIPSSHWNILQMYQDRMISTESGQLLDINVETVGRDTVMVGNTAVDATHYRLKSDINVDLWYDDQSRWVKLTFETKGQNIEYVLNELY
jgi:hypothetical protein